MFENKFVLLLITLLWMSGLFAIVLTLAYMVQDRRQHGHDYGWSIPRVLLPLYAALATFCFGLALHAYAAQQPVSLWITIVWALLAISFLVRMFRVFFIGFQAGWETRLNARLFHLDSVGFGEQRSRIPLWGGVVVALLLVNLFLLGRWGSSQIREGAFAQQPLEPAQNEKTPPIVNGAQVAAQAPATNTLSVVVVGVTATATVEPTLAEPPTTPTPQLAAVVTVTTTESISSEAATISTLLPAIEAVQPSITVQNAKGANVRQGPSLQAGIITVLDDGTAMPVEGRTVDNQWFLILLPDGQTGWISVQVAQPNEAVANSPVLTMN